MYRKIYEQKKLGINFFSKLISCIACFILGMTLMLATVNNQAPDLVTTEDIEFFTLATGVAIWIALVLVIIEISLYKASPNDDIKAEFAERISKCFDNNRSITNQDELLFQILSMSGIFEEIYILEILNKFSDIKSRLTYKVRDVKVDNKKSIELVLYSNEVEVASIKI